MMMVYQHGFVFRVPPKIAHRTHITMPFFQSYQKIDADCRNHKTNHPSKYNNRPF